MWGWDTARTPRRTEPRGYSLRWVMIVLTGVTCAAAHADVAKWSGGGATDNWTNPFNWDGVRAPLSNVEDTEVEFNAVAARTQADVNAPFSVRSIEFNSDREFGFQQSFTLIASDDGKLTIGRGGIDNNTDKDQTFNVRITLAGDQIWRTDDSTLFFGGARDGAFDLELRGNVTVLPSGGGASFAPGVFVFSGNGAFHTGNIEVDNASLLLGANDTISSASTVRLANSRSRLQLLGADEEIGGLSGFSGTVVIGARRLTVGANHANTSFSGELQGNGEFVKTGAGKLDLLGNNAAFTGAARIEAGTLRVASGNGISDQSTVTVAAGAKFAVDDGESIGALAGGGVVEIAADLVTGVNHAGTTFSGAITGIGNLTKGGGGTFLLTGNNTFQGATAVNAGILGAGPGNSLSDLHGVSVASGAILEIFGDTERIGSLSGAGTVALDGQTLEIGADDGLGIFAGQITKVGNLVKLGTGRLTLVGRNTFKGSVIVQRGTLEVGTGDNLQDLHDVVVDSGGTFEVRVDREDIGGLSGTGKVSIGSTLGVGFDDENADFDGRLDGSGNFVKRGRGTQALRGSGDLAGDVLVDQGVLHVGDRGELASANGGIGVGTAADRDAQVRVDGLASWKILDSLSLARRGTLTIADAALVKVGGATQVTDRSILRLEGGSLFADSITLTGGSAFEFLGGRLAVGKFIGPLINAGGTLAPGASPGLMEVQGDFTQFAGGVLEVELAAHAHDRVEVNGRATLGGILQVHLLDGFAPAAGSVFDILVADDGIAGAFTQVLLPNLVNRRFDLSVVDTQRLRLTVAPVPLPPAAVLFATALVFLGGATRKTLASHA
ncbi:MAG: autotransporter-associated beta strand repeat-containing protein [Gammaproteobacteria bacterium]